MSIWKTLFVAAVISASAWMYFLIDNGLDLGWPHNTVRNWEQFGLIHLHGELITNPGGFEITEHPEVYHGMSPVCLYMPYFATVIFGWTGLGALSFHILLSFAVFWGIWELLGRNHFAAIVAAAAILCPGYMRWPEIYDPNTLAILPVIPYAIIILAILRKQNPRPIFIAAIFALTLGFMSLNWTTSWVCGPCILLFWGMSGVNRRTLVWFIAIMVISGLAIVAVSVIAKSGMGKAGVGSSHLGGFLSNYTWGNTGYGQGLTTGKAFVRLAFTNGIGLLPLWLALIFAITRRFRDGSLPWFAFTPLGLTVVEVAFMRNYFGHHPWMAGPVLLIAAVFSIALLRSSSHGDVRETIPQRFVPVAALSCFLYGLAVLMFFRANATDTLALIGLVRDHTARSDMIVVVKNLDPETARLADRFDELMDRHVIVVDNPQDLAAEKYHCVILSSVKLDGTFKLAAQSSSDAQSWLTKVADWFNHSIARRNPGDRMELSTTYFLYESNL